jgi:hypothetical protein
MGRGRSKSFTAMVNYLKTFRIFFQLAMSRRRLLRLCYLIFMAKAMMTDALVAVTI